jgi:tetratricopeptide (TPR) repeat protein
MRTFLKFVIVLQILLPLANPTVCTPANAQSLDEITTVNKRVGELLSQGRYRDALAAAQRAVALAQQSGSEDAGSATALFNLATIYQNQERNREAEPLHRRALDIREKILRPDHPDIALSIVRLADVYGAQRRPGDPQLLYERWLTVLQRELGPEKAALGIRCSYRGSFSAGDLSFIPRMPDDADVGHFA